MALQILNNPSFGSQLGSALGTGLGSGLQSLAQGYTEGKDVQRKYNALLAMNFSPQEAQSYANLPDQMLQQLIKEKQEQGYNAGLAQALSGLGGANKDTQQNLPMLKPRDALKIAEIQQQQRAQDDIKKAQTQENLLQDELGDIQSDISQSSLANNEDLKPNKTDESSNYKEVEKLNTSEARLQRTVNAREKKLSTKLHPKIRKELKKEQAEDQKRLDKIKEKREVSAKQLQEKFAGSAADNQESLSAINRNIELNKSGKMDTPGYLAALENFGLNDIESLKSGDTVEFVKNNGIFLKGLKQLFGGRITDNEVRLFTKLLANPSMSVEQRHRILSNMKRSTEAREAWRDAISDVIKSNEGIPPSATELERLAAKRVKPILDELAKEFKAAIKDADLPPEEGKLTTAAKAIGSRALSGLPGALKGATKGASAGAALGRLGGLQGLGLGTTGGAIGGGILGALGMI